MKISVPMQKAITTIICISYILLFAYASISKFLDFRNFQVQLGQSPLIGLYAHWLAWIVPTSEIIIAFTLCFQKLQFWSLYAGYVLMVLFTVYIVFILNFSSSIPCSCGGILESLGWEQHLVFNSLFVLIAVVGLIYLNNSRKKLIYKSS